MSADPTERVIDQVRALGYRVEAGTLGYSIRMVATAPDGRAFEATAPDPLLAAQDLLKQVERT